MVPPHSEISRERARPPLNQMFRSVLHRSGSAGTGIQVNCVVPETQWNCYAVSKGPPPYGSFVRQQEIIKTCPSEGVLGGASELHDIFTDASEIHTKTNIRVLYNMRM